MTEAVSEQTHDDDHTVGRRYFRWQVLTAGGLVLALGAGIGVGGTKLFDYIRGRNANLQPAAVAKELGDKCLQLHVQPSVQNAGEEQKKFGKGSSCTVYWTRGALTGVEITDGETPQFGVTTLSVFEPQNETPTSWDWGIDGHVGSRNYASIQAFTAHNGVYAGYTVYGSGCEPGKCYDVQSSPITYAYVPGVADTEQGLLTTISYVGNLMLDHPKNPI